MQVHRGSVRNMLGYIRGSLLRWHSAAGYYSLYSYRPNSARVVDDLKHLRIALEMGVHVEH